jgi:DNA modification methylase
MGVEIRIGDCRDVLTTLPSESVNCIVTSPPYFGLRDYGCDGQIGLEPTPDAFVAELVAVFREARRVLRDDGTLWLNLGDSYAGSGRGGHVSDTSTLQGSIIHEQEARRAKGSQLKPGFHAAAAEGGAIGRAWVPPPQGLKQKDLIGIPWRVAFALQADGWYLRQDIIWAKPNPMPESVRDRCTKAHEYLFLMSKGPRYHYDAAAIAEPASEWLMKQIEQGYEGEATKDFAQGGAQDASATKRRIIEGAQKRLGRKRGEFNDKDGTPEGREAFKAITLTRNRRSVWEVATQPFSGAHFATMPPALAEPCILAGCPAGGTVLDPFGGAGTTGLVAQKLGRNALLIELNPAYAEIAERRIRGADVGLPLGAVA